MSDIAIAWNGQSADIVFTETDLAVDDSLKTAIIISLFTDRRVGKERGWWGDTFESEPIGSRLWLLDREKRKQEVPLRANEYTKEALRWLIKQGIAKSIKVDSYFERENILIIPVEIMRPDGESVNFKFSSNWEALKQ